MEYTNYIGNWSVKENTKQEKFASESYCKVEEINNISFVACNKPENNSYWILSIDNSMSYKNTIGISTEHKSCFQDLKDYLLTPKTIPEKINVL